ncbi:hypothetical protein V8C26DRAFT_253091 [Trichoderma gracile]
MGGRSVNLGVASFSCFIALGHIWACSSFIISDGISPMRTLTARYLGIDLWCDITGKIPFLSTLRRRCRPGLSRSFRLMPTIPARTGQSKLYHHIMPVNIDDNLLFFPTAEKSIGGDGTEVEARCLQDVMMCKALIISLLYMSSMDSYQGRKGECLTKPVPLADAIPNYLVDGKTWLKRPSLLSNANTAKQPIWNFHHSFGISRKQ